jgi:hypothetical protein
VRFEETEPHSTFVLSSVWPISIKPTYLRGFIQKFRDWVDNEINDDNIKHFKKQHKGLWRQNSLDWLIKIAIQLPLVAELYHLQFLLQAASPETFRYTLVYVKWFVYSLHFISRATIWPLYTPESPFTYYDVTTCSRALSEKLIVTQVLS